jgi:hypothetical protein
MSGEIKNREFIAERDSRIFKMRQAGVAVSEIAKRFQISQKSVGRAIERQLQILNRDTALAYPEVLRMELERLDSLQAAMWPLTQHRKITTDDGSEIQVEPDPKAVQQVLGIMDRRSKLLGMEVQAHQVQLDVRGQDEAPIRATIAGQEHMEKAKPSFSPEIEAKKLLRLMGSAGVLPLSTVTQLLGEAPILEAEVVPRELENEVTYGNGQHGQS